MATIIVAWTASPVPAGAAVAAWGGAAAPPPPPQVTCQACLLLDDEGDVLAERDADLQLPMASTTKMVTAILVVDEAGLDEEVTVSATAAAIGNAGVDLLAGDRFSVEELLYALLLSSSNDASVALAEHVAGSEDQFVTRMNEYASSVGASNTNFATPHGLDHPNHYSSAADLVLFGDKLMEIPELASIVAKKRVVITGPRGREAIKNRNLLLKTYRGAIGIKTGFTTLAGNVLVAAAERHGRRLTVVVMHSTDSFLDGKRLLDYGWKLMRSEVVIPAGDEVADVVFGAGTLPIRTAVDVTGPWPRSELEVEFTPDPGVDDPIAAGQKVGTVDIKFHDRTVATVDAVAARDLVNERPSLIVTLLAGLLGALASAVT